ncbi:GPW/gp25 family protein [Microbulbifer sp. PSTR4-B]|uniref:GPW/gp25 family protein n=1 Tax=unclassified Microbulbifer TaxID=2619833 RepID=UPI00403B1993
MQYGMNNRTGAAITQLEHLRQSVTDILTTPKGSRLMRRDYGSEVFRSVDAPLTRTTIVDIYAAAGEALGIWEPRLQVAAMQVQRLDSGGLTLRISGYLVESGESITLEGIDL